MLLLCSAIGTVNERLRRKFKAQVAKKWRVRIWACLVLRIWVLAIERATCDLNEVLAIQGSEMLTEEAKRPSHTLCIVSERVCATDKRIRHTKNLG